MTPRSVALITRPGIQRHGSGLVTYDVGADHIGAAIEPFIFVSLYDMTGPTFPPHPHAGFSVATYILPESPIGFINQDSLGNRNRIAPGALHVTVAGSGVIHEEQPEKPGAAARGFQIWIDHRTADREIAPHALHVRNDAMPSVRDAGMTGRVVLGEVLGNTAPVAAPTPVHVVDVELEAGGELRLPLPSGENIFLFLHRGSVMEADQSLAAPAVIVLADDGDTITATAGPDGARLTLFAGAPLGEARVQQGPFVGSDYGQLARFFGNYQGGVFGALPPIAAQPDWTPNDGQIIP